MLSVASNNIVSVNKNRKAFTSKRLPGEKKEKVKRRKRKRILPKNYDPNVEPDPERWLPRWQRSTFKKKKDKRKDKDVGKGTQGAVAGDPG